MPSSSFLLRLGSLLLATCIAPSFQAQQYALKDDYTSNLGTFWDQWNWYSAGDPTHGHVKYLTRDAASAAGLLGTADGAVTFAADSKNVAPGGRPSIRLESKAVYNHGLFIADFSHVPDSACGSWPAYWTFGPNWPHSGEIDIFENVNRATNNLVTLHSGSNCIVNSDGGQTGTLGYNNCDSSSGDTRGCSVADPRGNSFGSGFNAANGGVYAMQWTSASIKVWFFPRGSEPSDINGASPNPSLWGSPVASFQGCDIDSHFKDHQIIFDMTFCGDWAGNVFANDPVCGKLGSCIDYVSNNPGAFSGVYFGVRSLKVYQLTEVVLKEITTTIATPTLSTTSTSSTSISSSTIVSSSTSISSFISSASSTSSSTSSPTSTGTTFTGTDTTGTASTGTASTTGTASISSADRSTASSSTDTTGTATATASASTSEPTGLATKTELSASSTPSTTATTLSPVPTNVFPVSSATFSKVGTESQSGTITTTESGGTGTSTVIAATKTPCPSRQLRRGLRADGEEEEVEEV